MDGVIEMTDVDYPHGHTNQGDDLQDKQQQGDVYDIFSLKPAILKCLRHDMKLTVADTARLTHL